MAIAFRSAGAAVNTGDLYPNSLAIPVPAGIQNGDKLFVLYAGADNDSTFSNNAYNDTPWPHWPDNSGWPIDTLPAGWTLVSARVTYDVGYIVAVHDVTDAGSEPASYTFNLGVSELDLISYPGEACVDYQAGQMFAYSGLPSGAVVARDDDPSYTLGSTPSYTSHAPNGDVLILHQAPYYVNSFYNPESPLTLDPFTTTTAGELRLFFGAHGWTEYGSMSMSAGWTQRGYGRYAEHTSGSLGQAIFFYDNITDTPGTYSTDVFDLGIGYADLVMYDYVSFPGGAGEPDPDPNLDTDGDGVPDIIDAFPDDPNLWSLTTDSQVTSMARYAAIDLAGASDVYATESDVTSLAVYTAVDLYSATNDYATQAQVTSVIGYCAFLPDTILTDEFYLMSLDGKGAVAQKKLVKIQFSEEPFACVRQENISMNVLGYDMVQFGRSWRVWTGVIEVDTTSSDDTITLRDLIALFKEREFLLYEPLLGHLSCDRDGFTPVHWEGPFPTFWSGPMHDYAEVKFKFVETVRG